MATGKCVVGRRTQATGDTAMNRHVQMIEVEWL